MPCDTLIAADEETFEEKLYSKDFNLKIASDFRKDLIKNHCIHNDSKQQLSAQMTDMNNFIKKITTHK
jgi:hypothetical protein